MLGTDLRSLVVYTIDSTRRTGTQTTKICWRLLISIPEIYIVFAHVGRLGSRRKVPGIRMRNWVLKYTRLRFGLGFRALG